MASLRLGLPLLGVAEGVGILRANFGVGVRDKGGLGGVRKVEVSGPDGLRMFRGWVCGATE